ncbi:MAG: hypothetical protein DRJ21_01890 [Candidatus Methanomethylicota archaeon]|uniref:Leucine-binding protein domain-containing protein n=1 Tax=Thermoproteota archaeon TaxID=2056631 RepID=A0A497ESJ0_9CREN|nr:MAG: hypothetical protein DRJ21_01890 [Candidatus Verstraetearchaeota archaeon]
MKFKGVSLSASLLVLVVVVAIVSGAAGFYVGSFQKPAKPAGPELPGVIKIGVLLPLSGDLAEIGEKMKNGAVLAAEEINNAGGISGRKIQLVIRDTQTNPAVAVEAFNELVNVEGVKVVVGPAISPAVLSVAPIANEKKVVVVSPSATAPAISESSNDPGNFVFRVVGSDALQGEAMAEMANSMGFKKAVCLVINNDYGVGLANTIKEKFKGKVLMVVKYDPNALSYRAEISEIKSAKPDVVFFVAFVKSGSKILKDARVEGLNVSWISSEGIADVAMFSDLEVAEYMVKVGMMGTKPRSPIGTPAYKKFAEKYRARFGEDPGLYSDYTYDAVKLVALAVAFAGEYSGEAIRDALFMVSQNYVGVTGPKSFNEYGDVPQEYDVWKVVYVNGEYKFEIVGQWTPMTGFKWASEH